MLFGFIKISLTENRHKDILHFLSTLPSKVKVLSFISLLFPNCKYRLSKVRYIAYETCLMCLSFTREVTWWPIPGQLMGLQGTWKWRPPPPMVTSALPGFPCWGLCTLGAQQDFLRGLWARAALWESHSSSSPPICTLLKCTCLWLGGHTAAFYTLPSSSSFSHLKGRHTSYPFWFWLRVLPPKVWKVLVPKKGLIWRFKVRSTSFN